MDEIVTLNSQIRKLEEENRVLKSRNVERKPELSVEIVCEGAWKVESKDIPRPEYVLAEYLPLSIESANGLCSVEEIEKYNQGLPSEASVQNYIDSLHMYKYKTEAYVEFEFFVENSGKCKANDINVSIEYPEDLIVLERDEIKEMSEPKAPSKPKNPINEAIKKKRLGGAFDYLETLHNSSRLAGTPLYSAIKPFNINYSREIVDNRIKLEIKNLLHTYCMNYDQYAIVPTKKGKFQIKCTIMCEEFLEPVEQVIDIEVI